MIAPLPIEEGLRAIAYPPGVLTTADKVEHCIYMQALLRSELHSLEEDAPLPPQQEEKKERRQRLTVALTSSLKESLSKFPTTDKVTRLLQPTFVPIEVDSRQTVGKLLCGPLSESYLVNQIPQLIYFLLWIIGFTISELVMFNLLPSDCLYLTILTWPTVLCNVSLMNVKTLPMLTFNFLTIYGTFYLIMYVICIALIFKDSAWMTFSMSCFLSLFHVYFYDALPEKSRLMVVKVGSGFAIVFLVLLAYGIQTHPDITSKDVIFWEGMTSGGFRASTLCFGANLNMIALFMKHLYAAITKPKCLVILKSDVESVKLRVEDARIVRAMMGASLKDAREAVASPKSKASPGGKSGNN
jgi:hypothetical protein